MQSRHAKCGRVGLHGVRIGEGLNARPDSRKGFIGGRDRELVEPTYPELAVGRELAFLGIEVGDAGEHTTLVTSGTLVCVGDVMDELCPVVQC